MRKAVALEMAHASSEKEALDNKDKRKVYMEFMDSGKVPMAGYVDPSSGKYLRGIEDYIPNAQYRQDAHTHAVVEDIRENFRRLSTGKGDEAFAFMEFLPHPAFRMRLTTIDCSRKWHRNLK